MKITIANLKDNKVRKYEGYIWGSDDKKPIILSDDVLPFEKLETNVPYIVEALLYCKAENTSVLIRHTGDYQMAEYDLSNLPEGSETHDVQYLSNRLGDLKKVNFQQLWIPEEDKNCEDMKVLKMKALIFTGFDHLKNQEND